MAKKTPKRNPVRFGGGGQYAPRFAVLEEARDAFFEAVRCVCPEAIRDLRATVFPVYERWYRSADPATKASAVPRNLTLLEKAALWVAEAVFGWCAKWHLAGVMEAMEDEHSETTREYENERGELVRETRESWTGYGEDWDVIVWARAQWPEYWVLATLAVWSDRESGSRLLAKDPPELPRTVLFFTPGRARIMVKFQLQSWDGLEAVDSLRRRLRAGADRWLKTYLKARRKELEQFMMRAPGKHSLEHFEWLALFQVGGMAESEIMRRYGVKDPITISKAIHSVAKLIGLAIRNAPVRKPAPKRRRQGN